jgi:type I restriction enzyme R subunit
MWDDRRYAPRPISGFLKKEELERLIFRRSQRKRLHLLPISDAIVDRSYQQEAIRRIAERFDTTELPQSPAGDGHRDWQDPHRDRPH